MNFVSSITLAFKDSFSSGFNDAKSSLAGMKSALDDMNQNSSMNRLAADMAMMTSMTDPMRKALSDAMEQPSRIAGTLDSSFRNIQAGLGASNEEMAVMRRELLAISGRSVAGPEAVSSAFADVATSVADASKHMAVMNAAVALSEANQADLAQSTSAMINVMNAWNLSAEQASLAADIFTQTNIMGVGSVEEFAGAISNISALAAGAGIGLDELGASMAYATTKGFSAGQAQKQLKGIISTLASPSETLAGIYEQLGFESGQAMLQQYGLADSLAILKTALGDDEQAFQSIIGSTEAATFALALAEDAYVDFAGSFAEGMGTITEAARGVQLESIEAKMSRLDSASKSLQAQIGQDINGIKGIFIDMKFGFLSNVVSPIMSSPVGGAVSKIAAVTGMAAKTMLDMGSGALNAAAQMTTLAANISNAGGIAKLFHSGIGLAGSSLKILATPLRVAGGGILSMGKSIIGALPAIGSYIASMWASVAPTLAATWPILAIIAAVALLAGGVYLLIKNWDKVAGFFSGLWGKIKGAFSAAWDWIKNLIFGTSDWILGAIAVFFPIIGIPALIIKHWDAIKGFFGNLWGNVTSKTKAAWDAIPGFFSNIAGGIKSVWNAIPGFFSGLWGKIKGAFSAAWDWIKNLIFGTSDWILGAVAIFMPIIGIPALIIKHWDAIKGFFGNLWGNVTSKTKAAWDAIPGFFSNIAGGIKSVWNAIPGFFSGLWEKVKGAFSAAWDWIKNLLFGTSDWVLGAVAIFMPIVGIPALIIKHWDAIKQFFVNLWNDPKATIMGFIDWVSSKVEALVAPFKIVGDVVGGVFNKVGGFFKGLVGGGKESGAALNDAFASGIQSNAGAPGAAFGTSLQTVSRQMPHSDAQEGPLSTLTASGRALTETFASGMDGSALEQKSATVFSQILPEANQQIPFTGSAVNESDLREKASLAFSASVPQREPIEIPAGNEGPAKSAGSQTIHIQNLNLQADECQSIFDFVKMIMHSVDQPLEVPA